MDEAVSKSLGTPDFKELLSLKLHNWTFLEENYEAGPVPYLYENEQETVIHLTGLNQKMQMSKRGAKNVKQWHNSYTK